MATLLSTQLQALAVGRERGVVVGGTTTKPNTRVSILFNPAEAADIDLQTIFALAQAGFHELIELDGRFAAYSKTLFSVDSIQMDRELQSQEFNDKLNNSISSFLRLLSSYIMLTPAHQALEYLVRRYKVHIYNVEEIILCVLPYHETTLFVRIVKILHLNKTKWQFLKGVQQTGAAPPRSVLVQRCINDAAVLNTICDAIKVSRAVSKSRTIASFSAIIVMEMLAAVPSVSTEIVNQILPFVLHSTEAVLHAGCLIHVFVVVSEFQVGALMIVGTLANRTQLAPSLLETLGDLSARFFQKESELENSPLLQLALMVMIQLMQTQEFEKFPPKPFKSLVRIRNICLLLAKMVETFDASRFLALLLTALVQHCTVHTHYEQMLLSMVSIVPIHHHVALLVTNLLELYIGNGSDKSLWVLMCTGRVVKQILKAVERQFPAELDTAVTSWLERTQEDGTGVKEGPRMQALRDIFYGSLHMPLADSNTSLYLSVDHPEAKIREAAVHQLMELGSTLPSSNEAAEMKIIICDTLLRRANDDQFSVVRAVLSGDSLVMLVPAEKCFHTLATVITRCRNIIKSGSKPQQREAKAVATLALKLLSSQFLELHPSFTEKVASVMADHLLVSQKTLKLNMMVLKLAGKMSFGLFQGLSEWNEETPVSKQSQKSRKTDYNASGIASNVYRLLDTQPSLLLEKLLLMVLYKLLEIVPSNEEGQAGQWQQMLTRFFVLLASGPSIDKFSLHLDLFLRRLSGNVFPFLADFFTEEVAPSMLHKHSLDLLASHYAHFVTISESELQKLKQALPSDFDNLQVALPSLLVELASPIQVIRRSAGECVQQLHLLLENHQNVLSTAEVKDSSTLPLEVLREMLKAIAEAKGSFGADEKYASSFLASLLGDSSTQCLVFRMDNCNNRCSRLKLQTFSRIMGRFSSLRFFAWSVVLQLVLLKMLQGVGNELEQISGTIVKLEHLLLRRSHHHLLQDESPPDANNRLSASELELLEVLLQVDGGGSASDEAVTRPCLVALSCLTPDFYEHLHVSVQEQVFGTLILLSSSTLVDIHSAAHVSSNFVQVPTAIVSKLLKSLCNPNRAPSGSPARKKRKVHVSKTAEEPNAAWPTTPELELSYTTSLLEVLLWLPITSDRQELVESLFTLLKCSQSGTWPSSASKTTEISGDEKEKSKTVNLDYVEQLILMALERVIALSHFQGGEQEVMAVDITAVVQCVAEASDVALRNQALTLLTAISRVSPDLVLKHVIDILTAIGASTITQNDNYSHEVAQQTLVAVVPCWLTTKEDPTTLLQVVITALPQVPVHRRMALVTTLLRVMQEDIGLHPFFQLLLQGVLAEPKSKVVHKERKENNGELLPVAGCWELEFAEQLCQQYAPHVWLPALVRLLRTVDTQLLPVATNFVTSQLQILAVNNVQPDLQETYVSLLEQVMLQLQSDKKGNQGVAYALLNVLTAIMAPLSYLDGIVTLLQHPDTDVQRKVLRLYITRMKNEGTAKESSSRRKKVDSSSIEIDEVTTEHDLQEKMGFQIARLLSLPVEDASLSTKRVAVEALEVCAKRLGATDSSVALSACLPAVIAMFDTKKKALNAAAVRCVTTLLCILGPRGLPSLPTIISHLLATAEHSLPSAKQVGEHSGETEGKSQLLIAVLKAMEAIVENLGAFLSPYLGDIIGLVTLEPSILTAANEELSKRAAAVRLLIPEKIPARLLLDPLVSSYNRALDSGAEVTCALFQMMAALAAKLDRTSVLSYHSKIFNTCLMALDLRHNRPQSFHSMTEVETSVVNTLVALILKLSESSFKPLFVSLLEWAQSNLTHTDTGTSYNVNRNIAFYKLVNQLTEKLRSLFVPYFSYLLDGCVQILTRGQKVAEAEVSKPKKKQKRLTTEGTTASAKLSWAEWHLRQLVLSSFHKCFLYDSVGYLDAAKFQLLLGPIVSQLLVEPPIEDSSDINMTEWVTVQQMDDTLVSCLGQMALTAGTDLLWKPLNHEVLMCSRSEKVRPRLLALRVVKLLAEQLKEEFLVLLPETLPFLAELLEDADLNVVANTQGVIKNLEDLSGENLAQYF
ncbi:unnamed protein product [Sphagnum compactum]